MGRWKFNRVRKLAVHLRRWLTRGPTPNREIQRRARALGYSGSSLDRAKRLLGVVHAGGAGPGSTTIWALPVTVISDEHYGQDPRARETSRSPKTSTPTGTCALARPSLSGLSITDTRLSTLLLPPSPSAAPPFEVLLHIDRVDYASMFEQHELVGLSAASGNTATTAQLSTPRDDLPVLIESIVTDGLAGCSHRGRHHFPSPPRRRSSPRRRRGNRTDGPSVGSSAPRSPEYYRQCQQHVTDYPDVDSTRGSLRYDPSHGFMPAFRYSFTHDRDRHLDLRCVAAQRQAIEDALHQQLLPGVDPQVALLQLSYLELSLDITRQPSRWDHHGDWDHQLFPIILSLIEVNRYRALELRVDQREIIVGSRDGGWFLRCYDRHGRVRVEMAFKGWWLREHSVDDVQDLDKLPLTKLLHYEVTGDLDALRDTLATALLRAIGDTLTGQSAGDRVYTPVSVPTPTPLRMRYRSPRERDRKSVRRAREAGPGWETVAEAIGENAADRLYGFGLLSQHEWLDYLMASPELEHLYCYRRAPEDMTNDPVWAAKHLTEVIPELEVALKAARHIGERAAITVVLDAALQVQRVVQAYQAGDVALTEADVRSAVSGYVGVVFYALNVDVWKAAA